MNQDKLNIAVFVDYDNIEIGVKSTLRREFHLGPVLDALKERGMLAAKFAYAHWGRLENATRQMAENAVQMVQRIPTPRGDKNGGDINLALDALEMAFTHQHINAFAIVSGDSDFIPLVNKLKEYGKTVFIVGGKGFTSTILQQNCSEFISYESLIGNSRPQERPQQDRPVVVQQDRPPLQQQQRQQQRSQQDRPTRIEALQLTLARPLVDRALEVLERREVTAQLGLLKSTMQQLSPTFSERDYGARSFSDFIDMLAKAGWVKVVGAGGKAVIERKESTEPQQQPRTPEEALPFLKKLLDSHAAEMAEGVTADQVQAWAYVEAPDFDWQAYGFQAFAELINFAQDRSMLRTELDEERGLRAFPAIPEPVHHEAQPQASESEPEPESELIPQPVEEQAMAAGAGAEAIDGGEAQSVGEQSDSPAPKKSSRGRRRPSSPRKSAVKRSQPAE